MEKRKVKELVKLLGGIYLFCSHLYKSGREVLLFFNICISDQLLFLIFTEAEYLFMKKNLDCYVSKCVNYLFGDKFVFLFLWSIGGNILNKLILSFPQNIVEIVDIS